MITGLAAAAIRSAASASAFGSGAIRVGRWKLIERFEDGTLELYDLERDVGEISECSSAHPEVTDRLHGMLKRWREETEAPVPTELNPEYAGE